MVGTVRKQSSETDAEIRVLVDGEEIWSRHLGREDAIPHAFDVLALDLSGTSAVDVLVMAGPNSPRVRVTVAFQIVPEPYASRWRADLPSGFPETSESERQIQREKGQQVLRQIREASGTGRGERVAIPPGDYRFNADWSRESTLKDLADLEIDAHGVTFWFEPPMVHGLLFENCRNVAVRGLTIDFAIPCWFQARVTEIDRQNNTIGAALMKGYAPRSADGKVETSGNRAFMFYDARGRFINHRHSPGTWQLSEDGHSLLCREIGRHGIPSALRTGDYIVGTIRTGAALRSVKCSDMRFEDVNIWSSPGMAVNEGGGEGGHIYRRVRATRRPFTNRLQAFGADVFHLAGTDRGPTLDRCELAYGADDNLNIHGSFGRVVERVDERHYYMQGAYDLGDTLEFRDHMSVDLLGIAKAVSAERTPAGPSLAINDRYSAKGEFLVGLSQPLELPALSLVVMDGKRSAHGFALRNCWLHDNFQRTLINGSPGGLIENTTLQNVGHGVCIQFETWGPWMEGPFARDLVIRNNRFLDAPPDGPAIAVSMHPPGGGSDRRRFEAKPVKNLTISGNYFARTDGVPVTIHNVDGLRIHGNSIDRAPGASPSDRTDWLDLQDCSNTSIRENHTPGGGHPEEETSVENLPMGPSRGAVDTSGSPHAELRSVPMADVKWTTGFWADRLDLCRNSMLPRLHSTLLDPECSAQLNRLKFGAGMIETNPEAVAWSDGDCYKWIEAMAHAYSVRRDPELEQLMDEWIAVIAQAQHEDGYISVNMTGKERFKNARDHETYNMGHLMTAACMHHRATGKTSFLDVAEKVGDYLCTTFAHADRHVIGYSSIMGIVSLYRVTGDRKYLDLANRFIDLHGAGDTEYRRTVVRDLSGTDQRQDRVPFRKETEAVGHAVWGTYLYCGVADVVAETGDRELHAALERVWESVARRKMDITGSVVYGGLRTKRGDTVHEAFGLDYTLPNLYNETCANIGFGMWSWRMLMLTGEAEYADAMERVAYNCLNAAVDLKGENWFYCNPLTWDGKAEHGHPHHTGRRWRTNNCYCCPPNIGRTTAKMHNWVYSTSEDGLWVHLYGGNRLATTLPDGSALELTQQTDFPWDGKIRFTVNEAGDEAFAIHLRIPEWTENAGLRINGERSTGSLVPGAYTRAGRHWQPGDVIELDLPMPIRLMQANAEAGNLHNKVAVVRGPLVYCLELPKQEDGEATWRNGVFLPENIELTPEHLRDFLGGVTVLNGTALTFDGCEKLMQDDPDARTPSPVADDGLYRPLKPRDLRAPTAGTVEISLIPYYAWANRGLAMMDVWIPLAGEGALSEQRELRAQRKASTYKDEESGYTVVNDDDPSIAYGPGVRSKTTRGLINNDEHYTKTKGSFFEFTFTGTDIVWMGSKGPWRGYADVSIDGRKVAEVNPYAPKQKLRVELYKKSGLPHAEHTIRIVCQARKGDPDGQDPYINLDAFKWRGAFF